LGLKQYETNYSFGVDAIGTIEKLVGSIGTIGKLVGKHMKQIIASVFTTSEIWWENNMKQKNWWENNMKQNKIGGKII